MKPSRRPPRTPSELSDSIRHQLNMYALAASAAGVGVSALAHPAEGKIIYTKADKVVGRGGTLHIDLNHDGISDFTLKNTFGSTTEGYGWDRLFAMPARQKNAIWGHTARGFGYASALSPNSWVGPKGQFLPGSGSMAASTTSGGGNGRGHPATSRGPWCNVADRYLGLKFVIKGKAHFGWARLNVTCRDLTVNATLTGYAYETIPGKGILTGKEHGNDEGQVATLSSGRSTALGQLARGSAGRPGE